MSVEAECCGWMSWAESAGYAANPLVRNLSGPSWNPLEEAHRVYAPAEVDVTLTVNQMMASYPKTVAVFNQFGMDTCCGSGVAIPDAARRDGVNLEQLLKALAEAMAAA